MNSSILFSAWNDFRLINNNNWSKPGYAFSTDDGQTWSEDIILNGFSNGFDPSVAFDEYGNAYYCYIATNVQALGGVYISKTNSYAPPYIWDFHHLVSNSTIQQDKPWITVDNTGGSYDGRLYFSWTDFNGPFSKIKFKYSSDHGNTFSDEFTVSLINEPPGDYIYSLPRDLDYEVEVSYSAVTGSMVRVSSNGKLYVIWIAGDPFTGQGTIYSRKSIDGGDNFDDPAIVTDLNLYGSEPPYSIVSSLPSLAIDQQTGNIYIAYSEQINGQLKARFVKSTDDGETWSNPISITNGSGEDFSSISFAQPFEIAWGTTYYYSIDPYANDLYYYFTQDNKFHKTNITSLKDTVADFPSIPRFANKSHFAVYAQQNNFVLKDLEKDTSYILFTTPQNIIDNSYSFSPNDSNIIVFDRYYSFKDSQSYPLSFEFIYWDPDYSQWSSDSTILSLDFGNVILQRYLYSNKIDTFFSLGDDISLSSYSYNNLINSLTYSIYDLDNPPKLYLHNFETNSDSVLFDPSLDDSSQIGPCWSNPIAITSINVSPNKNRIAFFNPLLTNSGSGLYVFENDSGYTNMYLDCLNFGLKYTLEWLSNDTLIYFDATISLIYGIDVRPIIVSVPDFVQLKKFNSIEISSFPNPFNSSTSINIFLNKQATFDISIYNILGEKVFNSEEIIKPAGYFQFNWDGIDNNNITVNSGVYIVIIKGDMNSVMFSKGHKVLYLK